jgi:transposase
MDIYALHNKGLKTNTIARITGINWRTVKKYLENGFERKPYDTSSRKSKLTPYYPHIEHWLSENNYKATWIYDRLKLIGYEGSYDQVKRRVRQIKKNLSRKAYLRFETEAGRQAQVDFGEFQIETADGIKKVYLFAMVLGFSRKAYYEFIERRDMMSFLDCHIHAFEYFGGIPQEMLYDRMKNVLIRQLAGKLEWNREFYSFCLHYRFTPLAAPPYAPWVKGKVERPMHFVRESFWRGYAYRSLETANRDLLAWAHEKETRIHGTTHERIDTRFVKERHLLSGFPHTRFDTRVKAYRKVRKDCTLSYGANTYVVPHKAAGRPVLIKVNHFTIAIYLNDELLVSYRIPQGKGHFIQDERFYRALKADREQLARKYSHSFAYAKGRAKKTLGICTHYESTVAVPVRPIDDYLKAAEG